MFRNFLRTAGRNIVKYKAYSLINFLGLTTGLALALLVFTYVRSEMSFDKFHSKIDRLYRIKYHAPNGLELASSPPPIAPAMKDFFPEVEEAGRMYGRNVTIALPEAKESFEENSVFFTDSTIFKIFTFKLVRGSLDHALSEKFTTIINEQMAEKYFGDKDPIGETLIFGGNVSFKVIAVVKDFPETSHLRFNMLVPYDNMFDLENPASAEILRNNLAINFIISHSYTYVLLKPGSDPADVDQKMEAFVKKYAKPELIVGQVFTLMPVRDIHLTSTLLVEPTAPNTWTNLYIFIGIGILTLIIACINYVNLSTAQSFTRVKEIGIRRVLGSMKSQLILQFLAESFLFCLVALVIAVIVFYMALPFVNSLTGKELVFEHELDWVLTGCAAVLVLLITVMAGGYPAVFVTRFDSISSLKGSGINQHGGQFLRKSLVVFQLAIACMLLSGAMLIIKQLKFLEQRPLGFQKDQIINVALFSQNLNGIFRQNDSTFWTRLQTFRDGIEVMSGVRSTSLSSNAPGLGAVFRGTVPEGASQDQSQFLANLSVDYDFINLYGMELAAGRTFSKDYGTDQQESFIVNETAVREFNWGSAEQAIGKMLTREQKKGRVIGVVKDFNFTALTQPVSSMVMEISPNGYNTLSIKFENTDVTNTIEALRSKWNEMFPEKSFQFTFLDQQLESQYQNFANFATIIEIFSGVAILISCLGVYGLILFVVQRKVKEIGVRKVLGASVSGILALMYKDFVWLVVIGFGVGIPVSYYFLSQWMENFTYHTNIDAFTYLISFLLVSLIVAATVALQAVKASMANPVNSLRSE